MSLKSLLSFFKTIVIRLEFINNRRFKITRGKKSLEEIKITIHQKNTCGVHEQNKVFIIFKKSNVSLN